MTLSGNRGRRWAASAGALVLCAAALARADQPDPQKVAAAQALFNKGVAALEKKDFATACPLLAEAVSLEPDAIGARFVLAECYEGQGRIASAWSTYLQAQGQAEKAGRADRAKEAQKKAAALQPKLAMLTLVVPDAVRALPGLAIRRDGIDVGSAQWGTPLPVDKGSHAVVVTVTGRAPWEGRVDVVSDGATVPFEVQPPPPTAGAPAGSASAASSVSAAPSASATSAPSASSSPAGGFPVRTVGFVVGGVGLAALAGGAAAGIVALSQKGASGGCTFDPALGKDVCGAQSAVDARNSAVASGNWSTGLLIAGGAALAVGVTLVILGRSPGEPAAPPRAAVTVGPTGLRVAGSF